MMKRCIAVFTLVLLLCVSGCGEKEYAIVGQWEDENGRIYIIDSDGLIFQLDVNVPGDYITAVGFQDDGAPTTRNKWYKENGEYHWVIDTYAAGYDRTVEISGDTMSVDSFIGTLHRLKEPIPRSEVYWSTIDRENSAYVWHTLDELDKDK